MRIPVPLIAIIGADMNWNPRICSDRTANLAAWLLMLALVAAAAMAGRFIVG